MPFETIVRSQRRSRLRFFVFTCRNAKSDFRLHLVDALRRDHEAYYIWLKRRPVVAGPLNGDAPVEMPLASFLIFMWRFKRDNKVNVYFNSTNTYFPGVSLVLRLITAPGVWCLDMHDDLRYHNLSGWGKLREETIIRLLRACSNVTVHAAPVLAELFPKSRHLGNASHIRPLAHDTGTESGVLIIASFDERFDFNFVSKIAALCPGMQFHLHGWTRANDQVTAKQLKLLHEGHANIHYHGPYATNDLPGILSTYRVTLAPYLTDDPMTRYIDPLRYYHCLNAGLEVVSTDIPQARYLHRWIHVVRDVAECAKTLEAVQAGRLAKQPGYVPITWEQRVDRLVEILEDQPRVRALNETPPLGAQIEPHGVGARSETVSG